MATEAVMNVFVPLTLPNGNTDKKPIMAQPAMFTKDEWKFVVASLEFCKNLAPSVPTPIKKEAIFKACSVLGAMERWERENG